MSTTQDELADCLRDFARALRRHGQDMWALRMDASAAQVAAGETDGVDLALGAFGGMGSISDLPVPYDAELEALRARVHVLASRVRMQGHW